MTTIQCLQQFVKVSAGAPRLKFPAKDISFVCQIGTTILAPFRNNSEIHQCVVSLDRLTPSIIGRCKDPFEFCANDYAYIYIWLNYEPKITSGFKFHICFSVGHVLADGIEVAGFLGESVLLFATEIVAQTGRL